MSFIIMTCHLNEISKFLLMTNSHDLATNSKMKSNNFEKMLSIIVNSYL